MQTDSIKFCECGCGQPAPIATTNNKLYGWVKGQPVRFLSGHNSRLKVASRYPGIGIGGGKSAFLHQLRAERALGKPLPPRAVVHHADGSRSPNAPLVICENHAYHMLLHRRMKVRAAGGDPNRDRLCSRCRLPKPVDAFNRFKYGSDGLAPYCRDCWAVMKRNTWRRRRSA